MQIRHNRAERKSWMKAATTNRDWKRENFTNREKYKTTKWLSIQQGTTKQQQQQSSQERYEKRSAAFALQSAVLCNFIRDRIRCRFRYSFCRLGHQNLKMVRPGGRGESKNNSPLQWIEKCSKKISFFHHRAFFFPQTCLKTKQTKTKEKEKA